MRMGLHQTVFYRTVLYMTSFPNDTFGPTVELIKTTFSQYNKEELWLNSLILHLDLTKLFHHCEENLHSGIGFYRNIFVSAIHPLIYFSWNKFHAFCHHLLNSIINLIFATVNNIIIQSLIAIHFLKRQHL